MPKRLSKEERIRRLEENKEFIIKQRVNGFEKRMRAIYQARIDLLITMGPKPKERVAQSFTEMMNKGYARFVFFRARFYEHMGMSPTDAANRATQEYYRYRGRWIESRRSMDAWRR